MDSFMKTREEIEEGIGVTIADVKVVAKDIDH